MKRKIILGIDPGIKVTGYGIIDHLSQKMNLICCGTILPKTKKLENAFLTIFEEVEKLITQYHPHAISIETQFVHKNVQSSMKLSMVRAICMLAAAKHTIEVHEYAPKKAKMAATGSGSASKHQVQKMVEMRLNIKTAILSEDSADALALAICHAHYHKPPLAHV